MATYRREKREASGGNRCPLFVQRDKIERKLHTKDCEIDMGVGSMLEIAIDQIIRGAGLGLARGAARLGKTFALQRIIGKLEAAGVIVVVIIASRPIGGSISSFARAVIHQYGMEASSTSDAVKALADLLKGDPFSGFGRSVIFIVDEAQDLMSAVLETLRSLYDRGQKARLGLATFDLWKWQRAKRTLPPKAWAIKAAWLLLSKMPFAKWG